MNEPEPINTALLIQVLKPPKPTHLGKLDSFIHSIGTARLLVWLQEIGIRLV